SVWRAGGKKARRPNPRGVRPVEGPSAATADSARRALRRSRNATSPGPGGYRARADGTVPHSATRGRRRISADPHDTRQLAEAYQVRPGGVHSSRFFKGGYRPGRPRLISYDKKIKRGLPCSWYCRRAKPRGDANPAGRPVVQNDRAQSAGALRISLTMMFITMSGAMIMMMKVHRPADVC